MINSLKPEAIPGQSYYQLHRIHPWDCLNLRSDSLRY